MTLVFGGGGRVSDITQKKSGSDMVITKKSDARQTVTVQGWNDATHSIVYGGTMNASVQDLSGTTSTAARTRAARTEVWKKAGPAQA